MYPAVVDDPVSVCVCAMVHHYECMVHVRTCEPTHFTHVCACVCLCMYDCVCVRVCVQVLMESSSRRPKYCDRSVDSDAHPILRGHVCTFVYMCVATSRASHVCVCVCGQVEDWEKLERMWEHLFAHELHVFPESMYVCVCMYVCLNVRTHGELA